MTPASCATNSLEIDESEVFVSEDYLAQFPLGISKKIMQQPSRWKIQEEARKLVKNRSLWGCHRYLRRGEARASIIGYNDGNKVAHGYGGLFRCNSVWNCPICSGEISAVRALEVKRAIYQHHKTGGNVLMVTHTAPHNRDDLLEFLLSGIQLARRKMMNKKNYKKLMENTVGTIRALEVTYGDNGWHVHIHEIIFMKPGAPEIDIFNIRDYLLKFWQNACMDAGLDCPNEHGVKVQQGEKADEYITKWGKAEELLSGAGKTGGMNPWEMLRRSLEGDDKAGALFIEYSKAFKGRRQLVWSDGLKKQFKIEEKTDYEIGMEKEKNSEVVGSIDLATWVVVCEKGLRGEVLQKMDEGGISAVKIYLNGVMCGLGDGVREGPHKRLGVTYKKK